LLLADFLASAAFPFHTAIEPGKIFSFFVHWPHKFRRGKKFIAIHVSSYFDFSHYVKISAADTAQ
jgi:hypothetical protein